jgi:hypothetical protein
LKRDCRRFNVNVEHLSGADLTAFVIHTASSRTRSRAAATKSASGWRWARSGRNYSSSSFAKASRQS